MKREVKGEVFPDGIRYVCSMEASPDGRTSPFVSVVTGHANLPSPAYPATSLDITPAFLSGEMEEASPETNQSGVTMSPKISRNLLLSLAEKHGVDYRHYVCQFAVITFEVRWALSDGTYSPWIGRLFYVDDENLSNPAPNQFEASLHLVDPMLRLTKPHSDIDHRFIKDLGWLVSLRAAANGGLGENLYGGDCVQYLLSIEMPDEAERLNGDGDPLRFFTPDHYPLISVSADRLGYVFSTRPPTQGSEMLPVTWGNGVSDEIKKIGKADQACFFWEHLVDSPEDEVTGFPVPIYADWRQWVANAPTHELFDSDGYAEGDIDLIIIAIELSRRGSAAYNRARIGANPPDAAQNLPFPAVFMAEARLPPGDPNSRENIGWDITYVKEENRFAFFPEAAAVYAALYLSRLAGIPIQWPRVTIRGDMRIKWGHKVRLHMSNNGLGAKYSDLSLGLDGKTFRVLKATHSCSQEKMGPDSFTTKLSLFPILNNEV